MAKPDEAGLLAELFYDMLLVRRFEERVFELFDAGEQETARPPP